MDTAADKNRNIRVEDTYQASAGRVQLTGIQALARLPIDQHRRDLAAGRNIATLISGYEGSPLAGYDLELLRQRALLDANDIVLVPGLNEEAAATAVQGSQLVNTFDGATRDGVVGIWYGKAPGLDRATDALRHGNLMGAHPQGGALVLVGDDPAAKSSSVPCASDQSFADLAIPYLYPSDSQEILSLGLHAIELSRASGLWVGMKVVTAVADGSSTVDLGRELPNPQLPRGSGKHQPTSHLLQPRLGPLERDLVTTRLRLAEEYARRNRLNEIVGRSDHDTIGIVSAGRTYAETRAALRRFGIDEEALADSPIRLLKVTMPWPMAGEVVREFANGLAEILVVEEKRPFLELAVRDCLYGTAGSPAVHGQYGPDRHELFPAYGELDADLIAARLGPRLKAHDVSVVGSTDPAARDGRHLLPLAPIAKRAPYFCSGCPHNSSTKPAGDALVGGGIGCHALVLMMDEAQVGTVTGLSQMGGEGLQWIGMSPFTERRHFVQNLGDGTFDHSGSLAIRAAVAAGVNITYRLLYNSAVAMTGGQRAVGAMGVRQIVDVLRAEGVARIIVTTDEPRKYRRSRLPRQVSVRDRSQMEAAQHKLAEVPGVTVLIHDQECATEKRRKRKRGRMATPQTRVFINERICEGCGDCGQKSNCLSVQPVSTEHGRKTRIHQGSCNVDYSCLDGDCPAFMTVTNIGAPKQAGGLDGLAVEELRDPVPVVASNEFGVRLTGMGGTGVVTVSQVLAAAGLIAGWSARSLDQTGLAQKGGAVVSDVRFARGTDPHSNKLGAGECDLLLGCDLLVAADAANLAVTSAERTVGVLNIAEVATGHMVADVRQSFPDNQATAARILERVRPGASVLDAHRLTVGLFANDQYLNMLLVGVGFQMGAIPLPATAIEEAIRLNGVAVEKNLSAFRFGRLWVLDPSQVERHAARNRDNSNDAAAGRRIIKPRAATVEDLRAERAAELQRYQNADYARRFTSIVDAVRASEQRVKPDSTTLTEAVIRNLFKLMAYKDEYEVARLALDPSVAADLADQFGEAAKASWNLHPPVLRAMGMNRKLRLGPWFKPAFRLLHQMRRVRGTPWDPFGRARVRVLERELVEEYIDVVHEISMNLTVDNNELAVELAGLPDLVRGYEDIKIANAATYRARLETLRPLLAVAVPGTTPGSAGDGHREG